MKALEGISLNSRISLIVAGVIMFTFFAVQTCIVFGLCDPSLALAKFGWGCVVFFMPPFFKVVSEFLEQKEDTTSKLYQKNLYLEHAAKIIRHDMHSGINTYLPRGIKSLKRRITDEFAKEIGISSPMKLIEDGLQHAQKVYAGVYEFTNLVKEDAVLNKSLVSIKSILNDYLRLTAYKNQVILDDSLPEINVNEPLFCTAIDNLIRNGLKYNDSGTKWVKIYYEQSNIVVEDNGRGLTNDDFIKLSRPYARKTGQKETGSGLGLNITIEILKEHGFNIKAEKTEIGTKLYIEIKND
jgi:signal transduction histidine kinase